MYEDDSDLIPRNSQIYVTMMTRSTRATSKRSKTVVSKVEEEQQELSEKPEASVEDQDDDENNADKDEIKDNNDSDEDEDSDEDDDSDDDLFAQMDKVIQDPDKQARLQQAEELMSSKNNSGASGAPSGGNRRGNGPLRPVPDNYICKRCNAKGLHWFNDCPSFLDPHFVEPTHKYLAEVKGVPKIALQKLSKSLDDTDVNNNILVKGEDGVRRISFFHASYETRTSSIEHITGTL